MVKNKSKVNVINKDVVALEKKNMVEKVDKKSLLKTIIMCLLSFIFLLTITYIFAACVPYVVAFIGLLCGVESNLATINADALMWVIMSIGFLFWWVLLLFLIQKKVGSFCWKLLQTFIKKNK